MGEAPSKHRREDRLETADQATFLGMTFSPKPERSQGRHDGQGDERGSRQGDHDGRGHGLEHLPFDTLEGEDRHIDQGDHGHAKEHRAGDLTRGSRQLGRTLIFGQGSSEGPDTLLKPSQEILHHHHGTVDDEAEVDRAQTHQVGTGLGSGHAGEQQEERKGNRQRDEQRGPPMPQQHQQDDHDDQRTLEEVRLDGADGRADEIGAVIEHSDFHALRQVGTDGGELLDRAFRDFAGVLTGQHDGGADDGLLPVDGGRAHAGGVADRHAGDVTHGHGGSEAGGAKRDTRDILGGPHASVGADGEGLAAERNDAAAGVLGVATDGPQKFRHRYA